MAKNMIISKLKNGFGAEINKLNANKLSQSEVDQLRHLLYKNKVLILKNQNLSPEDYIEFSKKIGVPVKFVDPAYQHPEYPEIFVSSNMKNDNRKIGMDRVGYYWHTDSSFLKTPLPITMLYAQFVPEQGGETSFIDMCEIYNNFPGNIKSMLENKNSRHEGKWRYIITEKDAGLSVLEVLERDENLVPSSTHPVIIQHPIMKNKILYLNEGFTKRILEMSYEESEEFLNKIFDAVRHNKNIYSHRWQKNDLVIWDNRSVVHKASPAVRGQNRMMYRIGVSDGPFYIS
jgi:taurine dioxygenase